MKYISPADFAFITNKYHDTTKPFDPHKRRSYHGYEYEPCTGLSDEELRAGLLTLSVELDALAHPVAKARAIEYVLKNTRIDVNAHDYFIGIYSWDRLAKGGIMQAQSTRRLG